MNKIICYFNSNYIDINKNGKIIHIVSNSIVEGDIVNKVLFISDIRKYKIFSNILSNNVDIYLNHNIQEKDDIYYKSVFEELNCNLIRLFDTSKKIISPTLINSNNMYILFYKDRYYKIIPELLTSYLQHFNIDNLRIISKTRLPLNNKSKYYYYNYKDNIFIN